MSKVRRIFVEKKPAFAIQAKELLTEIKSYLGIQTVTGVRVLTRYDVEDISDQTYQQALKTVFSEPPVDEVYEESFDAEGSQVFSVEYLPGQYDQRADSAQQCVKLLNEEEEPIIRSATTYVIAGEIDQAQLEAIKNHCINPVDSRETGLDKPETLVDEFDEPEDVKIFEGFQKMPETELHTLYESLGLAMTYKDFLHIQNYFKEEEKRDPSMTEIRVLDTYWSDHCRHTTFSTELKDVIFEEGYYRQPIEETYQDYLKSYQTIYKGRDDKFVCLMDLALMAMKRLKKEGKLDDQEESDEINACSIVVPVEVDGQTEEWLVNFKNETHNHPTEIEPFGGAATCLGGAIRDPLSGRTYVYQAMRVTGAADPTVSVKETLEGKLPQKKLVRGAAHGYSSYGNQIGLATGYVKEIYHPDYVAKRMEIGAVMGAAPRRAVQRLTSDPGDIIILLGGRTGRDGIGGATGSSKAHNTESTAVCGAEVQKGNPPTERKIQRLFRREEVAHIIKKCNDFGAGGVSVAIGELAPGLRVQLDKVPKKYAGLDGTEIAISESQERMAVVIAPQDVQQFLAYAKEENLEAVEVAVVTEEPRLVLEWRGKEIVNISRAFLDTNGAHQETKVAVELPVKEENFFEKLEIPKVAKALETGDVKAAWLATLADLNVCSQKGLVEMFDGSIGAGSVFMPYGGKYQLTETQSMVAKLPVAEGKCDAVTMMAYGFDPYLSSWSPYHGAVYAVLESMARIVAAGGDYKKIRFTFQEYFRRMSEEPSRWSQPFAALLGAYRAQVAFGLPSIGGKDSMSGTFNEIDVPPTLVSFAVDVAKEQDIITPELKQAGNKLMIFKIAKDSYDLPIYGQVMKLYDAIHELIQKKAIVSAYALDGKGIAAAVNKMAFGNKLGVVLERDVCKDCLFAPHFGKLIAEVPENQVSLVEKTISAAMETYMKDAANNSECGDQSYCRVIGEVSKEQKFVYGTMELSIEEALRAWTGTLEKVFPTIAVAGKEDVSSELFQAENVYLCKHKVAKPKVFIPVFPGTNCEYDSAKAFERAGAEPIVKVFKNLSAEDIRDSVDVFVKAIDQSQIIMFPGGFSAGDEPEGSAKFFATAFRNQKIAEALKRLLTQRDGLMLGICNGFQALIKLGLVPYGEIRQQNTDSPTLTYNTIGRHISKMVYTKVVTNKSPWLAQAELGMTYCNPASHGEGRFVAPKEWLEKLFANGQVATQYVNEQGQPTMDEEWNINGSYMAIEGITSPDGRVLGKMAHSERRGEGVAVNIYGEQDMKLFESGVAYFK
ncbi:MAG: phosphoribosylformylglycinamidine synthase [Lachnospiraceae bacterium]|nr:phosphoribosylformylglycinamidine synthase [Lachnospiraceae bacterium]